MSGSFEDEAGMASRFFLFYLNKLINLGASRELNHDDLGQTSNLDKSYNLRNNFDIEWEKEMKKVPSKRSLWLVLWRTVGYNRLVLSMVMYGLYAALGYGPILILKVLVQHFSGMIELSKVSLWVLVSMMMVIPSLSGLLSAQSNVIMAHIAVQFRNALVNKIYRKALTLSPSSRQSSSTGQIINMFSADTAMIQRCLNMLNNSFLSPFQIIACLILIYREVGVSMFVGLGLLLIMIPVNASIFMVINLLRREKNKVSDLRVKMMNEILIGIRIIKYYAWEDAFQEKIQSIRFKELVYLRQIAYTLGVGFTLVLSAAPVVLPVLIFYTYVRLGNKLDAATAFTTISLFNIMQFPFAFLPMGLSNYSQATVSINRMLSFFQLEELVDYIDTDSDGDVVISMENANLSWILKEKENSPKPDNSLPIAVSKSKSDVVVSSSLKNESQNKEEEEELVTIELQDESNLPRVNRSIETLSNMNFSIKRGELVAIVGSVGSGKSSLLSSLLGELNLTSGHVRMSGSIAYCDQRAWILNASLKDNILFGLEYDEALFNFVIHVCCLKDDLKILPDGVLTEIGEKGINLSGGQKARVALARAVYRDADCYLLDDPFSAVDAHVSDQLFSRCLLGAIGNKTRILVTHQVHLLNKCDKIIYLENGSIKGFGTYDELKVMLTDALNASGMNTTSPTDIFNMFSFGNQLKTGPTLADIKSDPNLVKKMLEAEGDNSVSKSDTEKEPIKEDVKKPEALITIEERNTGNVELASYSYYLSSGGNWLVIAVVIVIIISQFFGIFSSFWLAEWGEETTDKRGLSTSRNTYYINYYALFLMIAIIFQTFRGLILAQHRLQASRILHLEMLTSVLSSSVAFFDTTPLGRILNRFSSDMGTVDEELSMTFNQLSNSYSMCLGALGAVAGATKGTFLILLTPLFYIYRNVETYFRKTNTAIARLESVSRSPIYSEFSQVLSGINSVRAYKSQERFVGQLERYVDRNSIAAVLVQLASQWLAIRLDILGSLVTFFVAVLAASAPDFLPPAYIGIGLSYSFQLTQYLKFAVRISAQNEAQMNAVERIRYYIDNIPQEEITDKKNNKSSGFCCSKANDAPVDKNYSLVVNSNESNQALDSWPSKGAITVDKVEMAYRDGPLVLKGVSFSVEPGEKIGIAGRTGSGKSSIMNALFRIEELKKGKIIIDGIDISKLPLKLLRSKLGIIPQDPVMFSSTVRFNLDPLDLYTDELLWGALENVGMKEVVLALPNKLEEEVAEGGDNFSAGQRQLICIARVLLRNPKILVMDEATASIDNESDRMIQEKIRDIFKESTVLTIAHRLHTIVDSSKIMVLDAGIAVEFDSPDKLLNRYDSLFKALWEKHKMSHT